MANIFLQIIKLTHFLQKTIYHLCILFWILNIQIFAVLGRNELMKFYREQSRHYQLFSFIGCREK